MSNDEEYPLAVIPFRHSYIDNVGNEYKIEDVLTPSKDDGPSLFEFQEKIGGTSV